MDGVLFKNTEMGGTLSFTLQFGCTVSRAMYFDCWNKIKVQYSHNRGYTWTTIEAIPFVS